VYDLKNYLQDASAICYLLKHGFYSTECLVLKTLTFLKCKVNVCRLTQKWADSKQPFSKMYSKAWVVAFDSLLYAGSPAGDFLKLLFYSTSIYLLNKKTIHRKLK
jgi:hypothetical protein